MWSVYRLCGEYFLSSRMNGAYREGGVRGVRKTGSDCPGWSLAGRGACRILAAQMSHVPLLNRFPREGGPCDGHSWDDEDVIEESID